MADPIWEIKYKGELVSIALDDLTRHRMREIGAALGEEFRIPQQFILKLMIGDMEAVAGALWVYAQIHGTVGGEKATDMVALDFSDADFEAVESKKKPARKKTDPTAAATVAATSSSETQSPSETSS